MIITCECKDINGVPIELGSKVCVYAKDYEIRSSEMSGDIEIIELDIEKPKPLKDVPLMMGTVIWEENQMAVLVHVDKMLVEWEAPPGAISMDFYNYAFEVIT